MAEPAAAVAGDKAAPPKNKMLPVVIAAYVAAALAGAALVERVLAPGMANIPAPTHREIVYVPASHAGGGAAASGEGDKKKEKAHGSGHGEGGGTTSGNVFLIEDLVVNPAGSGGTRYLATSIGLQSAVPTFLDDMKTKDAAVKDALIRVLSSKPVDQLADVSKREDIRAEILAEVGKLIPEEDVSAIYFVRFVLQ